MNSALDSDIGFKQDVHIGVEAASCKLYIKKQLRIRYVLRLKHHLCARLRCSVADPDLYVFGLLDLDPDPLVRGLDPDTDPSITKQK